MNDFELSCVQPIGRWNRLCITQWRFIRKQSNYCALSPSCLGQLRAAQYGQVADMAADMAADMVEDTLAADMVEDTTLAVDTTLAEDTTLAVDTTLGAMALGGD